MLEKVGLEHSSKSTKYELEGSYGEPVHEHFSFRKTAKLRRECNEDTFAATEQDRQRSRASYLMLPNDCSASKEFQEAHTVKLAPRG